MSKKENNIGINVIGGNGNNKITGNKIIGYSEAIRLDNTNSNNEITDNYMVDAIDSEISNIIDSLSKIEDGTLNSTTGVTYKDEILSILDDIKASSKNSFGEKARNALSLISDWITVQPSIKYLLNGITEAIQGLSP